MKEKRAIVGVLCIACLMLVSACKKESAGTDAGTGADAGADAQGYDLDDWSMCCGGKKNEVDEGEGWCSIRCEKDEDCPGGCLCSCEAEGCSVIVEIGVWGHSDRQCISVEFLKESGWVRMKRDGGSMR